MVVKAYRNSFTAFFFLVKWQVIASAEYETRKEVAILSKGERRFKRVL